MRHGILHHVTRAGDGLALNDDGVRAVAERSRRDDVGRTFSAQAFGPQPERRECGRDITLERRADVGPVARFERRLTVCTRAEPNDERLDRVIDRHG
ncbi:MAG TPA: hypothetical protein VN224_00460, partial [Xanthomonadales bacterium]|nr:hypothetical protein [Xanthomonadales bacterium]